MGIQAKQFKTQAIQVSVFTNNPGDISQAKILQPVLSAYSQLFDGGIAALPVPPDAPAEIPRVMLSSKDGMWRVQGGPERIDCFWSQVQESVDSTPVQPFEKVLEVITHIVRTSKLTIGRCAFVATRLLERDCPAEDLAAHFCNDTVRGGPISRSESFEIHNHKKYSLEFGKGLTFPVNSWVRCKTALTVGSNRPLIVVEQDFNTLLEELKTRTFSPDLLEMFFKSARKEVDSILGLYFPNTDIQ